MIGLTSIEAMWWARTIVGVLGTTAAVGVGAAWLVRRSAPTESACRVCGCTEWAACLGGCAWVEDPFDLGPLCSRCGPLEEVLFEDAEAWAADAAAGGLITSSPGRLFISELGGMFVGGEWHEVGVVESFEFEPAPRGEGT